MRISGTKASEAEIKAMRDEHERESQAETRIANRRTAERIAEQGFREGWSKYTWVETIEATLNKREVREVKEAATVVPQEDGTLPANGVPKLMTTAEWASLSAESRFKINLYFSGVGAPLAASSPVSTPVPPEQTPFCPVHKRLEDADALECEIGNDCVACSLNERRELLGLIAEFAAEGNTEDSVTVLSRLVEFYQTHAGDGRVVVSYPATASLTPVVEHCLVDRDAAARLAFDAVKDALRGKHNYSPLQVAATVAANVRKIPAAATYPDPPHHIVLKVYDVANKLWHQVDQMEGVKAADAVHALVVGILSPEVALPSPSVAARAAEIETRLGLLPLSLIDEIQHRRETIYKGFEHHEHAAEMKTDLDHALAIIDALRRSSVTAAGGDQHYFREGVLAACRAACPYCADSVRWGKAVRIEGSTRFWHTKEDQQPCMATDIRSALAAALRTSGEGETK